MTAGAAANILTIYDKIIRLVTEKPGAPRSINSKTHLQGYGARGLGWSEEAQQAFLDGPLYAAFQVRIEKKHLQPTINGSNVTIGDLAIAVFRIIRKQQRPRRRTTMTP